MKGIIFAILAVGVLAQADRDLSGFRPKHLNVFPRHKTFLPRIVGGEESQPHQFPHQVALFIDGGVFCGGSILDARNILTAAHCVEDASYVEVIAGAHNIKKHEDSQQNITSRKIVIHPGWESAFAINDIAILHLPKPLKLNEFVKPIVLYSGNSALVGENVTLSGWGVDADSASDFTDKLRHVTTTIITNDECRKAFRFVANSVICSSGRNGKGTCAGDSGGPLIRNNNAVIEQIGIASFGSVFFCEDGSPSAYTRITSFKDWIKKNRI